LIRDNFLIIRCKKVCIICAPSSFVDGGQSETALQNGLVGGDVREPHEKVSNHHRPEGVPDERVGIQTGGTNTSENG